MKLLNMNIDIIEEDGTAWAPNTLGVADMVNSRILLREGMKKDLRDSTLVHEAIHMIADIIGVPLDEEQTRQMTAGFYSLVVDNPGIIADMIENYADINYPEDTSERGN